MLKHSQTNLTPRGWRLSRQ